MPRAMPAESPGVIHYAMARGARVDPRLRARRLASEVATAGLGRKIDERVNRIYGLTADEIKLVEEAAR